MKNMIELPGKGDFYRTKNVEITQDEFTGMKKIYYRDCNIAMRSITDFTSIDMEVDILDEEKMPEYQKQMEKFKQKQPFGPDSEMIFPEPINYPKIPTKKVKIIGTCVFYYNTGARIIVDNFDEFEERYFNYLTNQKLDI